MKGKSVLFAAIIVSLIAAGLFAYRWRHADSQLHQTLRWTHFVMDSLETSVSFPHPPNATGVRDTLYWQWVATTAQLQSMRWQQAVQHWAGVRSTLLDELDIERLKQEGLEDPPRQLRENLLARPDLIPFPGVVGGTMRFASGDGIVLLAPPFAFARFEDGHIQGNMLLQYSVGPGAQIEWERLWASLE
jgi:hypothetical protein